MSVYQSANPLRDALLAGVSTVALTIASSSMPAWAGDRAPDLPAPAFFVSAEGGAACAFGDEDTGIKFFGVPAPLGNGDCGWTGRIGFGQERQPLFGGLVDYWGVFVRNTRTNDNVTAGAAIGPLGAATDISGRGESAEQRTILDFEVGRDIGVGGSSKVRLFGGLRYAHFKGSSSADWQGAYGGHVFTANLTGEHTFDGVGPRIGLMMRLPLDRNWGLELEGAVSALYGRHNPAFSGSTTGPAYFATFGGEQTSRGWVSNAETSAALSYSFWRGGPELAAGVRVEGWFDQVSRKEDVNFPETVSLDRNNWGPFVRLKVPVQ